MNRASSGLNRGRVTGCHLASALALGSVCSLMVGTGALAQSAASPSSVSLSQPQLTAQALQEGDREPNDTFAERERVPASTRRILGELSSESLSGADDEQTATLASGEVDDFTWSDLPPGTPFFAWIDNSVGNMDTMLAVLDGSGTLVTYDDDSSPVGNGLGSALGGQVNPDGTIRLQVTGFGDYNFDGILDFDEMGNEGTSTTPHSHAGDYTVYVKLGIDSFSSDIDYLSFSGYEPGTYFTVAMTLSDFFPTVGWLDDDGDLVSQGTYSYDNPEPNTLRLRGVVPQSGDINLVVSGEGDYLLQGSHRSQGEYLLTLDGEQAE